MARSEAPSARKAIDWQDWREDIATRVLPLYIARPWSAVSIDDIAEALGISYWQVYYAFDGQEDIYRACVNHLIDAVSQRIAEAPTALPSVNRTIQNYVRHCADLIGSDAYRHLLFLQLRDGHTDPWVGAACENRIAKPLRKGLEDAVAHAGRHHDLKIVILHGIPERYLTRLEAALALPKLLQHSDFVDQMYEKTVSSVAKEVFASTCTFDGFGEQCGAPSAVAA
ncbi:TetR/AcrR family transcriptional regulator [Parasphingopyxis lamellibrachiae]|uniref:TetR family transcriptional regulator n=1 Tax=Parasphingopyxis lamellibrachiae TaxID=680125 RepID=A0A3D9FI24_9SPHN|nr:TetR/AcrR family transcriptional regulator [Parasphingopyxis lamellibrachiae]RED16761.1 TetR family transcriptional regulator [Parasphingopyxis lamellibrachiae]